MKKHYTQKPEMVFISGVINELDIPEIELKFSTSNRKDFGKITLSADAANVIRELYPIDTIELQEQFFVLYLNRANKVIGFYRHTIGGTSGVVVDIKIILATAMKSLSSSIILAHNHPSGNTKPSDADIKLTRSLKEAARFADISVLDHLIITRDSYYSFADEGLLGIENKTNHSHKKSHTMKSLGKIVDTGTVPEYSSTDKYWGFQKEPQIIFSPEDKRFRKGVELPKGYLSHLNDIDSIPEFLRQHYAFRGFEFGNWTTQEDRQNYMMGLAISLYDLQHILSFDRQQIGFNGLLSLAFGSRGIPHTSGHFEPQSFVVNLTRHSADSFKYRADLHRRSVEYRHALLSRGLQSLAHEYGHALDYYSGTYVEPNHTKCLTGGMITWNVNVETHNHLAGLMKRLMDKICYDGNGQATEYIKRVKKYSSRKYLLQKNEIFARAFEKYINYKMKKKSWYNVFFTKFKYEEGSDKTVLYGYYLTDHELQAIERDFDHLIDAIRKSFRGVKQLIRKSSVSGYGVKKKVHSKKKGLGYLPAETIADGVMSIDDAKQASFDLIGLQDKWFKLIGQACKPTHFFVYGIGGSGKSSFILLFSQYLASLSYKILYVAGEQFGTPTFTELLKRLNITAGNNFKIVDSLKRLNPKDFDFVVLDSKDHVGVDLDTFLELKKQYPKQSFIILSQATKAGNFTGSEKWRNEVDVMLLAENGVIKSGQDKNRWGGAGEMNVFDKDDVGELQGLESSKKKQGNALPTKNSKKKNLRQPEWTEPKCLNRSDWQKLKTIKGLYDEGKYAEAMEYAMYNADTAIREEIPPNVWQDIGGTLTPTGKEKLKKLLSNPDNWHN